MKFILELVLATIVIFFVWNILKKIFFNMFYKYTGLRPNNNLQETKNSNTNMEKKVKWDAETVDYEEVKEKR